MVTHDPKVSHAMPSARCTRTRVRWSARQRSGSTPERLRGPHQRKFSTSSAALFRQDLHHAHVLSVHRHGLFAVWSAGRRAHVVHPLPAPTARSAWQTSAAVLHPTAAQGPVGPDPEARAAGRDWPEHPTVWRRLPGTRNQVHLAVSENYPTSSPRSTSPSEQASLTRHAHRRRGWRALTKRYG